MNQTLKKTLTKLFQETHKPGMNLSPIGILRVRVDPRNGLRFIPFEMTYGRPLLTTDILLEEEVNKDMEIYYHMHACKVTSSMSDSL